MTQHSLHSPVLVRHRTSRLAAWLLSLLLVFAVGLPLGAQQPTKLKYKRDVPAKLAKLTKISEDSALVLAQAKVPKGIVKALELEQENGKLIYSFEFSIPGKKGIEEVNVDAKTGKVGKPEHEDDETEKAEAASEKHKGGA